MAVQRRTSQDGGEKKDENFVDGCRTQLNGVNGSLNTLAQTYSSVISGNFLARKIFGADGWYWRLRENGNKTIYDYDKLLGRCLNPFAVRIFLGIHIRRLYNYLSTLGVLHTHIHMHNLE